MFQPGTSWAYGPGHDWAGQIIEKLTGLGLDEYQQQHIWRPLGATNTTFFPAARGLTPDDLHETVFRTREGLLHPEYAPTPSPWKLDCRDALGGSGLYSTPNDFIRLLGALLQGGGPILRQDSVDDLFRPQPQLGAAAKAAMRRYLSANGNRAKTKAWMWTKSSRMYWDRFMEVQQCLCGVVGSEAVDGTCRDQQGLWIGRGRRRRQGSVNWGSLLNLMWFIDRESGVAATYFTQTLTGAEPATECLCMQLEQALFRIVNGESPPWDAREIP